MSDELLTSENAVPVYFSEEEMEKIKEFGIIEHLHWSRKEYAKSVVDMVESDDVDNIKIGSLPRRSEAFRVKFFKRDPVSNTIDIEVFYAGDTTIIWYIENCLSIASTDNFCGFLGTKYADEKVGELV